MNKVRGSKGKAKILIRNSYIKQINQFDKTQFLYKMIQLFDYFHFDVYQLFTSMLNPKYQSDQELAKSIFRLQEPNGFFRYLDPNTGELRQEGKFEKGQEVGLWKEFQEKGGQRHYEYVKKRVGAICRDGSNTNKTGQGACSRHGGVKEWIYECIKVQVKNESESHSLKTKVDQLKKKTKKMLKCQKDGLEFQEFILKLVIQLSEQNSRLKSKIKERGQPQRGKLFNNRIKVEIMEHKNFSQGQILQLLGPNEKQIGTVAKRNSKIKHSENLCQQKNGKQTQVDPSEKSPKAIKDSEEPADINTTKKLASNLNLDKKVERKQEQNESIAMNSEIGSDSDSFSSWGVSSVNDAVNWLDEERNQL